MTIPTQPIPTASAIARADGDLIALNAAALRLFKGQYRDSGDRHSDALFVREGLVLLQERLAPLDAARVRAEEELQKLKEHAAYDGKVCVDCLCLIDSKITPHTNSQLGSPGYGRQTYSHPACANARLFPSNPRRA